MQDSPRSPWTTRSLGASPKYRWRHGDLPALVGLGGAGNIGGTSTCWSARDPTPNAWAREKVLRGSSAPSSQDFPPPITPGRGSLLRSGGKCALDDLSTIPGSSHFSSLHAFSDEHSTLFAEASAAASSNGSPGGRSLLASGELPSLNAGWSTFSAPFGGIPRKLRPLTSTPAKMAAPVARPHNAWFLIVKWVPPIDGEADPEFKYELNHTSKGAKTCTLIQELGQDPWVQLAGLAHGTTHYFQVRGRNAHGAGEWSNWSVGYTVPEVPAVSSSAPSGLAESGGPSPSARLAPRPPASASDSTSSAVLEWEEPCSYGSQIIGYKLQYALDPDDPDAVVTLNLLSRRTSVEVKDLLPNRVYHFRVQAQNEVGHSAWTDWSDGVATRAVPPEEPSPPTFVEASARELVVQWSAPRNCGFGAEHYDLRIARDEDMTNPLTIHGPPESGSECTLRVTDLEPNTRYFFQVRACSAVGLSPWSKTSKGLLTGQAVPHRCNAPRLLRSFVASTDGRVTSTLEMQWPVPESHGLPIERYLLRWAAEPYMREELGRAEVDARQYEAVDGKVTYQVESLDPGAVFHFVVAAANSAGYGKPSAASEASRTSVAAPERPNPPVCVERTTRTALVEVLDTVRNNGSEVVRYELRWDRGPDMRTAIYCKEPMRLIWEDPIREREVFFDNGRRIRGQFVTKTRPRRFQRPVVGLKGRGPYYFSVRAINAEGHSRWSIASEPCYLNQHIPGAMPAPLLVKAFHDYMFLSYQHSADARPKPDESVLHYELRFARAEADFSSDPDCDKHFTLCETRSWKDADGPEELARDVRGSVTAVAASLSTRSWQPVTCYRWEPPPMIRGEHPPPIRVDKLLSGRSYVFQIRALAGDAGASPWSEMTAPFKTLPSRPEKPEPIIRGPTSHPSHIDFTMQLSECNGEPIKHIRLQMWGPYWKTRPPPTEWEEMIIQAPACDKVERVPKVLTPEEKAHASMPEIDYTEFWQYAVGCLKAGVAYKFRYACENAVGLSDWSDESDLIYTASEHPHQCEAPYLAADEEVSLGIHHLGLEWRPPHDGGSDILHYTLRWSMNEKMERAQLIEDIKETQYTLENLSPYRFYFVQVCATTAIGTGPFSKVDKKSSDGCFRTLPTVPGPPWRPPPEDPISVVLTKAVKGSKNGWTVKLSWGKPKEDGGRQVTRYKIFFAKLPDMDGAEEVVQKASRERILRGLQPETTYYIDVCAANHVGYGVRTGTPAKVVTPPLPEAKKLPPKRPFPPLVQAKDFTPQELEEPPRLERAVLDSGREETERAEWKKDDAILRGEGGGSPRSPGSPRSQGDQAGIKKPASRGDRRGSQQATLAMLEGLMPEPEKWVLDEKGFEKTKIIVYWQCPEVFHKTRGFVYDEESQTHQIHSYNVKLLQFQEAQFDFSRADSYLDIVNFIPDETRAEAIHTFEVQQVRDRRSVPKDEHNVVRVDMLPGRWYYASVQSINEVGISPWSGWSEVFRAANTYPNKVDPMTIEVLDRTPNSLFVQWVCPYGNGDSVESFSLRWRKETAETFTSDALIEEIPIDQVEVNEFGEETLLARDKAGTICQYNIMGLRHATHYIVEVVAANAVGLSDWTSSAPLRTASGLPSAPGPALGVPGAPTPTSVTAAWEAPEDDGGEPLLNYEVLWCILRCGAPAWPVDLETLFKGSVKRREVDAETRQVIGTNQDGLRPGDSMVPMVRARTIIGLGPWSRLPVAGREIEALSTLPTPPSPICHVPQIRRSAGLGVRPYSLNAAWRCPELNGLPIKRFSLAFRPADDSLADKVPQITLVHKRPSGEKPWDEGDEIVLQHVHVKMIPGMSYVVQVRACNALGDAASWGPPSEPEVAPADLPDTPKAPTSPFQWPSGIEVCWEEPCMNGAAVEEYEARFSLSPTMTPHKMVSKGQTYGTNRFFKIEELEALTDYYVQVRVRNVIGWSQWSPASEQIRTTTTRPKASQKLELHEVTSFALRVRWDPARDHGTPVTEYELLLVEGQAVHQLKQVLERVNGEFPKEHMREPILETLPTKLRVKVTTEDAMAGQEELVRYLAANKVSSTAVLSHGFDGLLGGIEFGVSVRAKNREGWSDWAEPLVPVRTLPARPEQCQALTSLEVGATVVRVQYALPYDNGDSILGMQMRCICIQGPKVRRLSGSVEDFGEDRREVIDISLPDPRPERAPPYGHGGTAEHTIEGLAHGTEYEVAIRAFNSIGTGEYSRGIRQICLPGAPDAPGPPRHVLKPDLNDPEKAARPRGNAPTSSRGPPVVRIGG